MRFFSMERLVGGGGLRLGTGSVTVPEYLRHNGSKNILRFFKVINLMLFWFSNLVLYGQHLLG